MLRDRERERAAEIFYISSVLGTMRNSRKKLN